MKTEITKTGWKEVTTKTFKVLKRFNSALASIGGWIETNERLGLKGRTRCACCKKPWRDMQSTKKVWLVVTNKGNKAVCGPCYDRFKEAPRV